MPELPEVEVVKKSLEREVSKKTIKKVKKIYDYNLRYKVNKNEISKINGLKIFKNRKKIKISYFFIERGLYMLVHLGMTGKFFIVKKIVLNKKLVFTMR